MTEKPTKEVVWQVNSAFVYGKAKNIWHKVYLRTVIFDGLLAHPPCCPKAGLLSSASSVRTREMRLLIKCLGRRSSSSLASRATSSAKSRSVNECGPNDTTFVPVSTVLSSNQSTPVAKESGSNTNPWWTNSRFNCEQALSDWYAWTQLTEYRMLINLTISSGITSL